MYICMHTYIIDLSTYIYIYMYISCEGVCHFTVTCASTTRSERLSFSPAAPRTVQWLLLQSSSGPQAASELSSRAFAG